MTASSPQAEFLRLAREGGRGALATVIGPEDAPALGRKLLVTPDGLAAGGLGDEQVDAGATEAAAELLWAERSEAASSAVCACSSTSSRPHRAC